MTDENEDLNDVPEAPEEEQAQDAPVLDWTCPDCGVAVSGPNEAGVSEAADRHMAVHAGTQKEAADGPPKEPVDGD